MKVPKKSPPKAMTLNITSMMDMFTIILVFLLFSFKAQDEEFQLAKGIKLPPSTSKLELTDALSIQMSADALIVQERMVLPLNNGRLPPNLPLEDGKIAMLLKVIEEEAAARLARNPFEKGDDDKKSIVVFQADKKVPFEEIDKVMKTAAAAGFPNFRFAVMKK